MVVVVVVSSTGGGGGQKELVHGMRLLLELLDRRLVLPQLLCLAQLLLHEPANAESAYTERAHDVASAFNCHDSRLALLLAQE